MYKLTISNGTAFYNDTEENMALLVPEEDCAGLVMMRPMPDAPPGACARCVDDPVSGLPLSELARARRAKSASILVPDATRGLPTAKIAPAVVHALVRGGIAQEHILFVVALGVHRDATEQELRDILGETLWGKVRIVNHMPFAPGNLVTLGTTSFGTPVTVNKAAYGQDLHICIGKAEPHAFAGFSGGPKSVLPGICAEETIRINHSPAKLFHPKSVPGCLGENPVHADMMEAAGLFGVDFCVIAALNERNRLAAVFAGGLEASHMAAVDFLKAYCRVCIPKPDVIVTTPGRPSNMDFYQSLKPLFALSGVLEAGMTVALYTPCPEGLNAPAMLRPFQHTHDLDDLIGHIKQRHEIQMDHALLLAKLLKKGVRLVVYAPRITDAALRAMYMLPANDPTDMLVKACALTGKPHARVLFYPEAQRTLPAFA